MTIEATNAATESKTTLTDTGLLYSAAARCRCGAGLARPLDNALAMELRAWICSAVLKGDPADLDNGDHDRLPFPFYRVCEETSINNDGAHTTRPAGTIARTVGNATCPQCRHAWVSEPYSACGLQHHWFSGACPACGYAVGDSGVYRSGEGHPIETRYSDVVLEERQ